MKTLDIIKRIEEYFFMNPSIKLRVRHIERELKLSLPSVIRYCKELEKEHILKKIVVSGIVFYSADRASKPYLIEKKASNIKTLFASGLVDFLISEFYNPPIIVFGSYSKGEDTENSDIDLYVETPLHKKVVFDKYERSLKRNIQIFIYNNINEIKNKELANNILNGVILNGYVEVFT